ncbi:hypothetical protein NTGM5_680013 [Candidatus Nitrotoga sp. M5]|nr:hypothetical protein NTGM5_680013 [Candidatus Nitrotoga sp. M5]
MRKKDMNGLRPKQAPLFQDERHKLARIASASQRMNGRSCAVNSGRPQLRTG